MANIPARERAAPGAAASRWSGYAAYAAPAIFLAFAATLAPWAFDFPLNDDWAYASAARTLAETGRLALSDWGSATQVPHLLWGALFVKLFGFSFGALRAANLLAAAAALSVFVKLLEECGAEPAESLLAALALAFSPLFLVLSNSFMTDVHYLLWMLAASLFYVRRIKDPGNTRAILLAGACAGAAYLTRQLGLALPLAFTAVQLARKRFGIREAALTWAPPGAAILGYYLWFNYVHGPTWASENYVGAATLSHLAKIGPFLAGSLFRSFAALMESGLLLLPPAAGLALCFRQFSGKNGFKRRVTPGLPWLALIGLGLFAAFNGSLPYLENSLSSSGLGTLTLGGAALKPSGIFASPAFWYAATAVSAASAALLLCAGDLALRAGGPELRFFFVSAALHFGISLLGAKFFDRYLLTLLPWFAAAAAFAAGRLKFSRPAAWTALAFFALLGWAGEKDYLAWNAAKWELATRPHQDLPAEDIVNGFDYEAWYNYGRNMAYLKSMKPLRLIGEWEWQKFTGYRAIVSYARDPRFKLLDEAEYSTPLSGSKGVIYLMELPRPARQ